MTTIAVVILNWNGKNDTLACLKSISSSQADGLEVLPMVVDNRSTDGSVESIHRAYPKTLIVENRDNLGFSEGNNIGIRIALEKKTDFVFILNNDTIIDKHCISQLIKAFNDYKDWSIIGPKIYFRAGKEFHKDLYKATDRGRVIWYAGGQLDWTTVLATHRGVDEVDHRQFDKPEQTDFASGCALIMRRQVFERIGLLNPDYFVYYEDLDFNIRARKAGFKIGFYPKAFLWHNNASSSGKPGSGLHDYYISRNRLIFGMKYAPYRTKLALFSESLVLLVKGRQWQRQAIVDYFLHRLGKGSYPL